MKKNALVDLQCYSATEVQDYFRNRIWKSCTKEKSSSKSTKVVKILAPLTYNPNAPDKDGVTPIHWAAREGYTEIVKILAHLTDNPNAPDNLGNTPSSYTKNEDIQRILTIEENVPRCFPTKKRSKKF